MSEIDENDDQTEQMFSDDPTDEETPGVGHNSGVNGTVKDQLRAFVERIERLNAEKDALAADIREVFAEAKSIGFDTKVLRKVIQARKMDKAEREEMEHIMSVYMIALGMESDLE